MKYEQHDQVDFRGKSPKDLTGRECWPGQPFIPEDVSSETSLQKSRTQLIMAAAFIPLGLGYWAMARLGRGRHGLSWGGPR